MATDLNPTTTRVSPIISRILGAAACMCMSAGATVAWGVGGSIFSIGLLWLLAVIEGELLNAINDR